MFMSSLAVMSSPVNLYQQSKQGKVAELRMELNSGGKKDKNNSAKKIALKKIVANMTMSNNDMVALFPDIIACMQIPSLEIKKMYADADPYVRKTAAFCVAKTYDHDRRLVESSDLIDKLNKMLSDNNSTVVASALAALMDIWERSESIKLTIDHASASKIVSIMGDCSE
ncbi:MAG: hypothetical protein Q9227_002832 [Pyrenula ochraceoflavens]